VDGWDETQRKSPFQPVKENWNAVTFLNQTASRPKPRTPVDRGNRSFFSPGTGL
jgi:hypothetical protein